MAFADEITVAALEADPYPNYARLRRESPVAWVPAANVWFVTRWQDVEFVSENAALFAAEVATSPVERSIGKPTILMTDGPQHDEPRLRPEIQAARWSISTACCQKQWTARPDA